MGATLVDSNVILDVITDDEEWGDWSADQLAEAAHGGTLIINPVIYAEVSVGFERIEDVDDALPVDYYRRLPLPFEAAFLAGQCFLEVSPARWRPAVADAGFLHRRPRGHCRLHAADPRRQALQDLLPVAPHHRALRRPSSCSY